jgi:hypothetical protein
VTADGVRLATLVLQLLTIGVLLVTLGIEIRLLMQLRRKR